MEWALESVAAVLVFLALIGFREKARRRALHSSQVQGLRRVPELARTVSPAPLSQGDSSADDSQSIFSDDYSSLGNQPAAVRRLLLAVERRDANLVMPLQAALECLVSIGNNIKVRIIPRSIFTSSYKPCRSAGTLSRSSLLSRTNSKQSGSSQLCLCPPAMETLHTIAFGPTFKQSQSRKRSSCFRILADLDTRLVHQIWNVVAAGINPESRDQLAPTMQNVGDLKRLLKSVTALLEVFEVGTSTS